MSDSSKLSVLPRSPPSAARSREPSNAFSDSFNLSVLSYSPSPPPGLLEKLAACASSPTSNAPRRGPNSHFLSNNAKHAASPSLPHSSKRLRVLPSNPKKVPRKKAPSSPRFPRSSRTLARKLPSPRSLATTVKSVPTIEPKGTGCLEHLPKEIRQAIYAYCLDIDEPVFIKECCGPTSTPRARASCKKHGDHCSKIGRGNGLTLYEEDKGTIKVHGRFSILSVSRSVNTEAFWVLYTQGKLIVRSTSTLQAYLSEKQCTFFRLPNLPPSEFVERMWLSAARFRKVCFELPWSKLTADDPVECVYRLYEASAFLMKAWDLLKEETASLRTVDVQLHELYTAILPFNSGSSFKMAYEWTAYHQPNLRHGYIADFELIGEEAVNIIERLVYLVGRHGGKSQWSVIAQAPRGYDMVGLNEEIDASTDKERGGLAGLRSLEGCCRMNDIYFEATSSLS